MPSTMPEGLRPFADISPLTCTRDARNLAGMAHPQKRIDTDGCREFAAWMKANSITQEEFAGRMKAVGVPVTQQTIAKYMVGGMRPDEEKTLAIQKITGILPIKWKTRSERASLLRLVRPLIRRSRGAA